MIYTIFRDFYTIRVKLYKNVFLFYHFLDWLKKNRREFPKKKKITTPGMASIKFQTLRECYRFATVSINDIRWNTCWQTVVKNTSQYWSRIKYVLNVSKTNFSITLLLLRIYSARDYSVAIMVLNILTLSSSRRDNAL